jgi:RNA polymerase sigma factor (sigma-70 family)
MQRLTDKQRDLVENNLKVARTAAFKGSRGIDEEDARQDAVIGIMDAALKFKPDRKVKFRTYALTRAVGAIKDAQRRAGIIKVGRDANGLNTDDVKRARRVVSCDAYDSINLPNWEGGHGGRGLDFFGACTDPGQVVEDADRSEWHERFYATLNRMQERKRTIIRMRMDGASMKNIGIAVGISESRICQLLPGLLREFAQMMGRSYVPEAFERESA